MVPPERGEGLLPPCSYEQGRIAGLKGNAAWLWLPAVAMAVSLGVTLPAPAQTAITGPGPVTLAADYPGQTSFRVDAGHTVDGGGGIGIYGDSSQNWTLTNAGTISGTGHSVLFGGGDDLLEIESGASFIGDVDGGAGVNSLVIASGTLSGPPIFTNFQDVRILSGAGGNFGSYYTAETITNQGTLTNTFPVATSSTTLLDNQGYFSNSTLLINDGTIDNSGTFDNSGTLDNCSCTSLFTNSGVLTNSGEVDGAIVLTASGSIDNSGLITGYGAVSGNAAIFGASGSNPVITNSGNITSTPFGAYGISLEGGGTVTNSGVGSYIYGGNTGVRILGTGSLANEGLIVGGGLGGPMRDGVYLGAGTVTNGGGANSTATIKGNYFGVYVAGAGTVTNFGTIQATYTSGPNDIVGVALAGGGLIQNLGTSAQIYGYSGGVSAGGTATVVNEGLIRGNIGVSLVDGAFINRGTSSYVGGLNAGVIFQATGTVVNEGYMSVANGEAVYIALDGLVTNGSSTDSVAGMYGADNGVKIQGNGTIANFGTILGGFEAGVNIGGDGVIANGDTANSIALIRGDYNGVQIRGHGEITNFGSITGLSGNGIYFDADGVVTNGGAANSTARIRGHYDGLYIYGTGTVTNFGTIIGQTNNGVKIGGDGTVTNGDTANGVALIRGDYDGIKMDGDGAVTNFGTILGETNQGVSIHGDGIVINGGGTGSPAAITGYYDGVKIRGNAGVTNFGTITGTTDTGVFIYGGGTVTNHAGGAINGYVAGVELDGAPGTIVNYGSISGDPGGGPSSAGIAIQYGGQISNLGTASSISGGFGIVLGGVTTIVNQGRITGSYAGVYGGALFGPGYGGIAINNSGTISGGAAGVFLIGLDNTVTNSGAASSIAGGTYGVSIFGQGSVHNDGTISGQLPVLFADLLGTYNNTLFNAGAITSTDGTAGTAVYFGAGDDRLILGAGYSFTGTVEGGPGTNTLEVFSGTARLHSVGTEFLDFQNMAIDADGTLLIAQGDVIAAGFSIANAGTVTNPGALTVAGTLTSTGLVVNNGSIQVTGTLTNAGNFSNNGTLVGDTNGLVSSGGEIINSGTIIGTANDGVLLTGGTLTNTGLVRGGAYGVVVSGGTVINKGTILDDAVAGVALGSNGSLTNNAGNTVAGVTGVVFTGTGASLTNFGTITGSGGIAIQFGAGTNTATLGTGSVLNGRIDGGGGASQLVLSGSNTLTSTITNFGAGSGLTIAGGAQWTASGNWAVASVTNAGTLVLPGGSPLNITGNFAQTSSGTLQLALDAGGTGSQMQVSGNASLAGSAVISATGTFTSTTRIAIVSAAGGVSGTLSGLSSNLGPLLGTGLSYDATHVFLTVTQLPVSSLTGETPNQSATAAAFDAGRAANPAAFAPTLIALDRLDAAGIKAGLDAMSGENIVDVSTVGLVAGRQFGHQLLQHALTTHGSDRGWTVWASGSGQSGHLDGDGNAHRLNEGVTGLALGADTLVIPGLRLGGALGLGSGHFNAGVTGRGRVQYTQLAATGSYVGDVLYIDAAVGGGFGSATTQRAIAIPGATSQALGHVASNQFLGAFEIGTLGVAMGQVNLAPFVRVETGTVYQDGFSETGSGTLNLGAPAQNASAAESTLGLRLGGDLPLGSLSVKADASLGWRHELADTIRAGQLAFAGTAGTGFRIAGASLPGEAAAFGLGLSTAISGDGAVWLHYDGDYAGHSTSHAFTFGLRFAW